MSEGVKPAPAKRLSRTEREALDAARDPILQLMLEREHVESDEVDTALLWRLLGYLRAHRGLTAACIGLSTIDALLLALPSYGIGLAVDEALRPGAREVSGGLAALLLSVVRSVGALVPAGTPPREGLVIAFALVIFALWVSRWAVAVTTTHTVQRLGQLIVHDLRLDVYRHLVGMDLGFFHKNPVGRLVNRTTFDVESLSQFFSDTFAQSVRDLLFIVVLFSIMGVMDWRLAGVLACAFPALVVAGLLYRAAVRPAMRTTSAVMSRMNAWSAENISGMRENQLYRTEPRRRGEFANLTDAHQASVTAWIRSWGIIRPVMMFILAVSTAAVLGVGYTRAVSGALTVGVLLTFLQYTGQLWGPIRSLTERFSQAQTALTAAERVFDILEKRSAMTDAPEADPTLAVERGQIELDGVRFAYPGTEDEVLRGLTVRVEPGQMLALVGDTGAGKSTIVHLLSRFYDVTGGQLRIDGHDVRAYTLSALRAGIALVPQDVTIFAGTIRENITLGLDVSDEEIMRCASAVQADRLIARFEDGLDHVMDEAGRTLSAGERQLISFARALVFNPPILILDEATANVDTETEALIQHALTTLTAGRTSVVVAHRLSTIRDADIILVLRHGQIVERGRHDDLLEMGGEYARLCALYSGASPPSHLSVTPPLSPGCGEG